MTDFRPGQPRPFGADELDGASGIAPDELAAATRVARDLEGVAARGTVRPSVDFTDRVMAAVASEPAAAPVRAARTALRHGALGAFLASLRDAWRVTVSPSFPTAVRAQAMAMVLLVATLAAGSGVATAGALGLLDGDRSSPTPSVEPSPSVQETPSLTTMPSDSAEPSESVSPSPSPSETAEPSESPEPTGSEEPSESPDDETAEPAGTTDGHSGSPAATRRPSATPTPSPTGTHPEESDHEGKSATPDPTRTPAPSETPHSGD